MIFQLLGLHNWGQSWEGEFSPSHKAELLHDLLRVCMLLFFQAYLGVTSYFAFAGQRIHFIGSLGSSLVPN